MIHWLRHNCSTTGPIRADLRVGSAALLCAVVAMIAQLFNLQPGRSVGCFGSRPAHRSETTASRGLRRGFGRVVTTLGLSLLLVLSATASLQAATAPGTTISNQASLTFDIGNGLETINSNVVSIITRTPAKIEFLKKAASLPSAKNINVPPTSYSNTGTAAGPYVPLLPALPPGLSNPVALATASSYNTGAPFFIRLTDLDQSNKTTIVVKVSCPDTGDVEWLELTETAPNSGIFAGYIPSTSVASGAGNGELSVTVGATITTEYEDADDGSDTTLTAALVDPFGILFDSTSGQPIDGATVTLIDTVTGLPATVLDNNLNPFPNPVVSGDSTLGFGPGEYRFPLITPGSYRLDIVPTMAYAPPPSVVPDNQLQALPGAPYALTIGSRGEDFVVNPGPTVHIDVPLDPAQTGLWLSKEVNRDNASIGDFLQYRLTLENLSEAATAQGIVIDDRLPKGFRYQEDSLEISGRKSTAPVIDKTGRQLQIAVGALGPGQRADISYVVEVGAGAIIGDAINLAQASDQLGNLSNQARARVDVRPPFFNNETFLIGRVLTGSCGVEDTEMDGVSGVRIYLEDGTYVVTDDQGRYHFEGLEPGLHVVQTDLASLPDGYEMIPCEQSSQTAGRAFSQFVDLQGGTLWRVNFYTAPQAPPTGDVSLQMRTELDDELARFSITLDARTIPAENLRLTVMLPGQSNYLVESAQLDGKAIAEPQALPGAVTFRLTQLPAGQPRTLQFQATLDTAQSAGELPAKALLTFDTVAEKNLRTPIAETRFRLKESHTSQTDEIKLYPRFPSFVAELQATDSLMLEQLVAQLRGQKISRVDIVGHTDSVDIAPRSRHIFSDNLALSKGRAQSVARFLGQHLDLSAADLTVRGMGASLPVADNATDQGRALNRRVELYLVTETATATSRLELAQASSPTQSTVTSGQQTAITEIQEVTPPLGTLQPPEIDNPWLATAKPERKLLWPVDGYIPSAPSLKVMVQHQQGETVNLELNGKAVPQLNYDGMKSRPDGKVAVSSWRGVDIRGGENRLLTTITDAQGSIVEREERFIHYATEPAYAELLAEQSVLVADGKTTPTLAIKLTDEQGHPIRPGLYGDFSLDLPYQALLSNDGEDVSIEETLGGKPRFITGRDGIALIRLEPTTRSGEAVVNIHLSNNNQEIRGWLKGAPRDWILVGFAEGTAGYNTFSGNQVSLEEAGIDEHFYDDGQVKFFAKGAVKGDWLLTLAYDSDKPNLDGDSLRQEIDPDTYYPLYGDGTKQGYEASSAHKVYIKLEKEQFYALFGDMSTGLSQTELSRYNRTMSGIKSELKTDKFSYTMFAADTKQAFAKDEIRGDGTSGRYTLSQKDLVINSETVTIETRDRFRSERVLETQALKRHTDYDIDYDSGTIFFKRPVPSKDESFNPIFIVARYETNDSEDENFNYGGRAAAKLLNKKIEVGATYVHEEKGSGDGDLYGTDVSVELTPQTTLHAEMAATETRLDDVDSDGQSYLAEVRHSSNRFKGSTYYREQQGAFGLGQQNDSETGTRKYGLDGSYQISPQVSVSGLAYHEDNLATDAKRDVAEVQSRYEGDRFGVHTGLRGARDKFDDGETKTSNQWLIGGNWLTANRKLNLRGDYEQSLGSKNNENSDFPTLLTLGADYKLTEKISLFAEQEFSWGEEANTDGTRVGFKATPWKGGNLSTSVEQQTNENAQRVFAVFGLGQSWQINKQWGVDASIDRGYTIKTPAPERVNNNVPPAHGADDDFTSVSVGATYRKAKWTWWNRLETRQAQTEDKYGVSTSVVGEPKDGVAVSAKALAFIAEVSGGARHTDGNIRLGAAYRPSSSRWILLNRLDFYFDKMDDSTSDYDNWRIVNNLHANFRLNRKLQMSFYYGLKYVRDNYNGRTYSGYTDLIAFETRYNITKRWDIGLHGSMLHSWNSNNFDYSAGADVGYSPITNTWVSLGYNVVGFEDNDFSAAHYSAQGAYMRIRAKFDQQSVKDAAQWLNR